MWLRCDGLSAMHAYLAAQTTIALPASELLRAEWVARVSALDMYVHELIAQRMLLIFEGKLSPTIQYNSFALSLETMARIRSASSPSDASSAFDLDVRKRLSLNTYQDPEKIADGLRLCSTAELWNQVAQHQGASGLDINKKAKALKSQLRAIVDRRNKIAHEGDLQPAMPRDPWGISQADLAIVSAFVNSIVISIDAVI